MRGLFGVFFLKTEDFYHAFIIILRIFFCFSYVLLHKTTIFIMLKIAVGHQFRQVTGGMVCLCSTIFEASDWKTQ